MVKSLKLGQPALYVQDHIRLDLTGAVDQEQVRRFVKDGVVAPDGVATSAPQLMVNVAATHAGIITRNNAFYQPATMRDGIGSFTRPFNKPVQTHHNDHGDPIGRVVGSDYVDISQRYTGPITEFRERFGGKTFLDTVGVNFQDAKDQLKWVLDNLVKMGDYHGLGYGKLQAVINDRAAAEKILDQRYLTVSVGFTTTEARCSVCSHDWAGEGPCEHTPGQVYDSYPMVLLPQSFMYDEVSFVNNPADQFAQVEGVQQVALTNLASVGQDSAKKSALVKVTPILLGVGGGGAIYRLNYQDSASEDREVLTVSTKKTETPDLVRQDGARWPADAAVLLEKDASRKHYLAEEGKSDHKHRVMVDPETGNGFTDYVDGHSHEVVNMKVRKGGRVEYDEESGRHEVMDEHTHPMGDEIERLYDNMADDNKTIKDKSGEGASDTETKAKKKKAPGAKTTPRGSVNKGPGQRLKKTIFGGGPGGTVDENKKSDLEVLVPADMEVPEGWVVVESDIEDAEYDVETPEALSEFETAQQKELDDQAPPQSEGPKDTPKAAKKKKAAKRSTPGGGGGEGIVTTKKDETEPEVLELALEDEVPEGYVVIENGYDITDEVCEDAERFYNDFVVPEILAQEGGEDAVLSAEQRKKLKGSSFCGPNRSFPVPDCAHVTAARRLIGRAKLSDSQKKRVLACVSRKARSLGCDKSSSKKDSIVTLTLGDNEYAVADLAGLNKALGQTNAQVIRDDADKVFEVARLFGVDRETFDDSLGKDVVTISLAEPQALETKATELESASGERFTDQTIDIFVDRLMELGEEKREELVTKLLDALHAKGLIPDYDGEFADLVQEKEDLEKRLAEATSANKDLYLARQRFYADQIVRYKEALGKEDYTELTDEKRDELITNLQVLSLEALKKEMDVLFKEVIDRVKTPGLTKDSKVEPGAEQTPGATKDETEETTVDLTDFSGENDHNYQAFRRLRDAFKRSGSGSRQG